MRFVILACAAATLIGCGYVGDPLPPALNIPVAVTDLQVMQIGNTLVLDYTAPALTTEDIGLTALSAAEIQVGDDVVPVPVPKPGEAAHVEIPAQRWVGKDVVLHIVLAGPKGQRSQQSNSVAMRIGEPLRVPSDLKADPHPEGVRVHWTVADSRATRYRIVREPQAEAIVKESEYIDRDTEAGKQYKYTVVAGTETAESLPSPPVTVVPRDVFPPAPPMNVNAIAGVSTIELAWDRSPESDLKIYRVYRDDMLLAPAVDGPAYSDKQLTSGKRYRYTITAVDQAGNESAKSNVAEATAP